MSTQTINETSRTTEWPVLISLFTFIFLIGTETFLVSPILPQIANNFSSTIRDAASIVTAYVLAYAFFAPLLGVMSDALGRKLFIVGGATIFCLGNIIASIASSLDILTFARCITGIGAAMAGPSIWAFIGDTTHHSIRGRIISFGMAAFSLGQVLGVPLGASITAWLGWQWAFRSLGIIILLITPFLLFYLRKYPHHKDVASKSKLRLLFGISHNKPVLLALASTFFWAAANLGSYTFVGAILQSRYQLSTQFLGLAVTVVGISSFIGSLVGGRFADYWRSKKRYEEQLVGFWSFLLGVAIFGFVVASALWLSLFFLAIWFIASGAFVTAQQTLLTILAADLRGATLSWNNSVMYAGTAVGVSLIGTFSARNAWLNMGWIGLLLGLVPIICVFLLSHIRSSTSL
jgi:DHA1 family inner membrane transport protein